MTQFKVGDRVTIGPNSIGVAVGTIFTVVDTLQVRGVWVDVNRKEVMLKYVDKGGKNCFADFTFVEDDKVKNKFSVGDRVVSIKDTPSVPEGWIGYVTDKRSPDYEYVCHKVGYENQTELFREDELELLIATNTITKETKPDVINSPKHYAVFEQVEAIQVIASSMTQEQFYGYCLGNILKYRLRAGGKDDVMQELGKADRYQELYTEHKHLCKDKE